MKDGPFRDVPTCIARVPNPVKIPNSNSIFKSFAGPTIPAREPTLNNPMRSNVDLAITKRMRVSIRSSALIPVSCVLELDRVPLLPAP